MRQPPYQRPLNSILPSFLYPLFDSVRRDYFRDAKGRFARDPTKQLLKQGHFVHADFGGIKVGEDSAAFKRLLKDLQDNTDKPNEAMAAAEYEQYFGVTLKRPQAIYDNGDPKAGFDYWVTNTGEKLDFMFTMYGFPQGKVEKLNKYFAHTDDEWGEKIRQFQRHFKKADIIPMDLRYLYKQNAIKVIEHVLSLPAQQQRQVVFITGGISWAFYL